MYTGKVIIANKFEDWWEVEDCFLLQISDKSYEKICDNYESKWWRYFDDGCIEESDIMLDVNLEDYIKSVSKKVRELTEENDSLKKQIEELSPMLKT